MNDSTESQMARLRVPATLGFFVDWLNSYGFAHQQNFRPSETRGLLGASSLQILHHRVWPAHHCLGFIGFDILPLDAELLSVTAVSAPWLDSSGRITDQRNPLEAELNSYFAELICAIRQRWGGAAPKDPAPDDLTPREREVAHFVALGLRDEDIAERLVIAKGTAKKHREKIARKWGMATQSLAEMRNEARGRGYGG